MTRKARLQPGPGSLFRVRLTLGARPVEGLELLTGGLYAKKTGKLLNRHVEPAGIGKLRDDTQICNCDLITKRVGTRCNHRLDGLKSRHDPMGVPGIDGVVLLLKRASHISERSRIVERMDVAGNDQSNCSRMSAGHRISGQERGIWGDLLEVLNDC